MEHCFNITEFPTLEKKTVLIIQLNTLHTSGTLNISSYSMDIGRG
jgi:hypothetical protein